MIEYYFIKEFQWKSNWVSESGLLKAKVFATDEFIKKFEFVDYNIVGQIFTSKKDFQNIEFIRIIISEIEKVIENENSKYIISSEIVLLEVKSEHTKVIDMLGDSEGVEAPLNWNISTLAQLQYIPTTEILKMFNDWKQFLEEQMDPPSIPSVTT